MGPLHTDTPNDHDTDFANLADAALQRPAIPVSMLKLAVQTR